MYVSFSGGKDSTVLLHLVRSLFPNVPAVFCNTGLEYPEIQQFVKSFENVEIIYPQKNFKEVITEFGYPLISKEVAEAAYYARRILPSDTHTHTHTENRTPRRRRMEFLGTRPRDDSQTVGLLRAQIERERERESTESSRDREAHKGAWCNWRRRCFLGVAGRFEEKSLFNKEKWLPLVRDLPVKISHKCCDVMKKSPNHKYARRTKREPYLGTMAAESRVRKQAWIRQGCNAFTGTRRKSAPLSFWTEQDILAYIQAFHLELAPVYGDIVENKNGKLECTGCDRTGCVYCAFGAHSEKGETRFQRLAKTHPRQYEYCMRGGEWIDNPAYDPTANMEPDENGWVNWNPKKILVPSKEGLGLKHVFDMCNEIIPGMYRYD